ncbi:hypothetical protein [uncultured Flavobacterium sp.]|uniref:hypothetical protein n=1 Tax=uncultured Flavobacterium sp. TaxID=165435 RepID=UPI002592474B|nr:hypothetical protein [uncultured Flavobacterium sp.]
MADQKELEQHFNNVCIAVDKYVGTKQEHINLQIAIDVIKSELFKKKDEKVIDDTNSAVG